MKSEMHSEADIETRQKTDAARRLLLHKLQTGQYKTWIDIALDPLSRLGGFMTGQKVPVPTWVSALFVGLMAYAFAYLTATQLNEPWFFGELQDALLSQVTLGTFALICAHTLGELLKKRLADTIIPKVHCLEGLNELEEGMASIFNPSRHFRVALFLAPVVYFVIAHGFAGGTETGLAGYAATGLVVFVSFESALCAFFMVPILSFLPTLTDLEFKLFPLNPRDSEIIVVLQDTTHQVLWIFTALFVPMTFLAQRLNLLHNTTMKVAMALGAWLPLIVVYAGAEWTFRRMIIKAKFVYLNRLQGEIGKLLDANPAPDQSMLERLSSLKEHHDAVVTTPNTAMHFRSVLSLAHTLLLPLMAALLANLEHLMGLWNGG